VFYVKHESLNLRKIKLLKNYFSLLILLVVGFNSLAQEAGVRSRHRPGFMWYYAGITAPKPEKVRKYDRLIFDVVYNDWTGKNVKPFKVSPLSIGFNTNLMFDIPLAVNNTVSLGIGMAYGIYRIKSNDFFVRNELQESTTLSSDINQYGIESSIFKIHTIALPLEIRFRGKNWQHAKLHVGGRIGYSFLATTVLGTQQDGIYYLQKTRGFYDFNPIQAQAHLRFGIRNWGIYAAYHFLPFFKNKQSIQMNGLQFGISLSIF